MRASAFLVGSRARDYWPRADSCPRSQIPLADQEPGLLRARHLLVTQIVHVVAAVYWVMEWKRVFHVAAIKSFSRGAHYGFARIVRYGRWIGRRRPAVHEHPEVLCRFLGPRGSAPAR